MVTGPWNSKTSNMKRSWRPLNNNVLWADCAV